ncbi:hypothetical protein N9P58_03815 [Puniceicoccaceae bacterium]|nr:hypothetical protein [Puniceicoccaceae bacterium]
MKKKFITLTQPLLKRLGLHLVREKEYERLLETQALLTALINQAHLPSNNALSEGISFVIFSKDRPLQLDGLLRSIQYHVKGVAAIHVLYRASDAAYECAYQELAKELQLDTPIHWMPESDFKADLIRTLGKVGTESLCFLVDDIIFIRPVDLAAIDKDAIRNGIVSLRLGQNINFCYTKQKPMQVPTLQTPTSSPLLQFSWKESTYDWAYPLSVDGHIFPTSEIQVAAEQLNYRAPNTFERALQILTPLYQDRPGYCFEAPRMLNIPLNRVQDEVENISGEIDPIYLLDKWNQELTLDFKILEAIETNSVHQETQISFTLR